MMRRLDSKQLLELNCTPAECSAEDALGWVLRISRLVGVAPVSLRKISSGWRVSMSSAWNLYGVAIVTLANAIILTGLIYDLHENLVNAVRGHSITTRLSWMSMVIVVVLTSSFASYRAMPRLRILLQTMDRIQKINRSINKKLSNERKKTAAFVISMIFYLNFIITDYSILFEETLRKKKNVYTVCMYSCYFFGYLTMFMMMLQFIFSALEARSTMKALNDLLEHALEPQSSDLVNFLGGSSINGISNSLPKTVRHISTMYGTMCDVVGQLDSSNGVGIVFLFTTCVIHLIFGPYTLITNLSNPLASRIKMFVEFNSVFFHLAWMLVIVEPCHETQKEMDRTCMIVSKLAIKQKDHLVTLELEKFARYLLLSKVTYSPMGIFTLTRSLIVTILASVTTYLVIVIQF